MLIQKAGISGYYQALLPSLKIRSRHCAGHRSALFLQTNPALPEMHPTHGISATAQHQPQKTQLQHIQRQALMPFALLHKVTLAAVTPWIKILRSPAPELLLTPRTAPALTSP